MSEDRRIFQRLQGIVNVRYAVRGRGKEKTESLPQNIGGGGLGICLTEKLQRGTVLDLEINVPDNPGKMIFEVGEVLWTKPFGPIGSGENINLYETGIKFINANSLEIGRVYSYYRQLQ